MIKNIYKKYKTIINYILSSGSSFVIDIVLFSIFLFFTKNILISGYLARVISSIINYLINKYLVFNSKKSKGKTMFGYFTLVVINITISNILVSLINRNMGINATVIKVVIDSLIFVGNFFIQKYIIFKNNNDSKAYKYIMPLVSFITLFIHLDSNGIIFDYNIYDYVMMLVTIVLLYYMYLKLFKKGNNKSINILSIIFSIFMVVGYSYSRIYTPSLIYNNEIHILVTLIKLFGYYHLISNSLYFIYNFITTYSFEDTKSYLKDIITKHPFLFAFIILFIVYGLYLFFYYPGVINYDNANQIKEVMGIHNRYLDSVVRINDSITLTNFNPIVHTLLLGNLFKFGNYIGNVNLGLFIYTFIQMLVIVTINAYSIKFLMEEKIKAKYVLIVLMLYILIPYYPFYSITCVKDSYWTAFLMLYLIKLYQFMKYKFSTKDYIVFILSLVLMVLFRNNGIVPILVSLPFVFVFNKSKLKPAIILTLFIAIFSIGYTKVLKLVQIPNTSPREVLSVPFQQTARYLKDYPNDIENSEKNIIDKILTYKSLAKRYEPELSDKVKNKYNIYTTKDDINKYFHVWARMFLRHPDAYINATISNNYGYFYPDDYDWYIYCNLNKKLSEAGFDYHFNKYVLPRLILMGEAIAFTKIPVVSLLVSCGFWTWLYLFLLLVIKQKKKMELIILLLPAFSLIFMCLIGPANTYFRYVYPYAATAPLIAILIIKSVNKKIQII